MTLDTADICRLCGKCGGLTYVFEESDLWLKIFMCFGVKIQKEDEITQKICKSCYFFTNSVYEFRLSAIQYNTDLRKAYELARSKTPEEEIVEEKTPIIYPSEETSTITQESFLNTFNLENKYHHPSVLKLKRKFPFVSVPKEWCELNIDPVVSLDSHEYNNYILNKKVKSTEDLGIWSVRNKPLNSSGKHQPDLVLTRVRPNPETSSNSDISELSKPQNQKKISPRRKRRRQWQKGKITPRGPKKITLKKRQGDVNDDFTYESNDIPSESDSVSINSTVEQDRNVLKNLLHTDAHLNDSLSDSSFAQSAQNGEDYSNLLVSIGEEVKTYICQTCNKVFDTQFALSNHKKYSHKSSLRCTKCYQRFNIVESLMKHNATCHPETVASTSQTTEKTNQIQKESSDETNETPIDSARKSVARKRTGAVLPKPSENQLENESESKIEIEQESELKVETNYDGYIISSDDDDDVQITNVIDNSSSNANEDMNSIISAVLAPQKITESEKSIIENTVTAEVNKESQSASNDVLLITDSDEEKIKSSNQSKPLPKLVAIQPAPSTSLLTTQVNHVNGSTLSFERSNANISQKIVVVPSSEDKEHMDAASNASVKAKITNELSYINYIFSKCNFADSNKKVDKKWFLKDIHKFTEKTILPIEVIQTDSDEVKAEYGRGALEKLNSKVPFWNPSRAIDINKQVSGVKESTVIKKGDLNNKYLPCEMRTIVQTPTTTTKTQTTAQTSHSVLENNITTCPTPDVQPSTSKTVRVEPTKPSSSLAVRVEPSKPASPAVKVDSIAVSKVTTTSVMPTVQSRTVTTNSVAKIGPTFVAPQNLQNQTVSSVASGSSTNNVVPSVSAPTKPYSTSPSMHNVALQNNRLKTYGRTVIYKPISPKPILPVSPNPSSTGDKNPPDQKQERKPAHGTFLVPNGYILMGVSTNKEEVSQNEENTGSSISNQPILLNGMPFSSLTNIRNPNPQMVLQPMAQQTNVNIQNCINICHQEVSSNTQQQYATITVPVMVPGQNEQPNQMVQPALATQSPQNQSSESNDSNGSRPAIRIKNLSELTGENSKHDQRNELHSMYTTALSNYVQTNTSKMTSASQDEYIQIS